MGQPAPLHVGFPGDGHFDPRLEMSSSGQGPPASRGGGGIPQNGHVARGAIGSRGGSKPFHRFGDSRQGMRPKANASVEYVSRQPRPQSGRRQRFGSVAQQASHGGSHRGGQGQAGGYSNHSYRFGGASLTPALKSIWFSNFDGENDKQCAFNLKPCFVSLRHYIWGREPGRESGR